MRSVLLASCVALIICHLADSASIISKSDVAKRAENAKPLGRKLNVQDHKTTNELIALLKTKISGQHIRQAEACPSDEFFDFETDTFGLFLYPSNDPTQEDNGSTADDNDDDHSDEHDDEDEHDEEDRHTDKKRKASRINTRSRHVVKHGRDDEDDSSMGIWSLFDETEEHESEGENHDDDDDSEDTEEHHDDTEEHESEGEHHDDDDDSEDTEEHHDDTEEHESEGEHHDDDDDSEDTEEHHDDTEEHESEGEHHDDDDDSEDTEEHHEDTEEHGSGYGSGSGSGSGRGLSHFGGRKSSMVAGKLHGKTSDTEEHGSGHGSGSGSGSGKGSSHLGGRKSKLHGKASEDVKASEYKELINLIRSNIHRQASIGRVKRSVRANGYQSTRGVNDARTDTQCSHVIETKQSVITVIVLANECDNGEVHLYNGNDASGEPYVVQCGLEEEVMFNTDGSVYIEYVYDSSSYYGGFELYWIGYN